MSMDLASPQSLPCPETDNSRESSPMPEIYEAEKNYASLQMSSAEVHQPETVSPLPSSVDLLIQDSPDSSTSPKVKLPMSGGKRAGRKEDEGQVKKQKIRTVFSQTQLCILNDRFQKQKYLSLQQMQELSNILNLSYKQVKTWFQNQRMKCKKWQKNTNWSKNGNSVIQKGSAPTEFPGLYSSYPQGCLANTSGNFPMWSNQTWNSPIWSSHSWSSQHWYTQAWNNNPVWNNQFQNSGEESLQLQVQFQQNSPASDLEATLGSAGENHNVIEQAAKYFSTLHTMDLFPNYFMNTQPEDV
ncbi:homeobox protein NANOG-like [Choloepus didactylus]|uniref:homeobox protein NANOG-like n=1 Tax=Choloepus didactylus TaxID=27675 RepID=UPI00189E4EA3|nr:homeobox protein NANOG-like [Choloepus didactylus]